MTAAAGSVVASVECPPRYADSVDLRTVIRQGETMRHQVTYTDDVWNFDGAIDIARTGSPTIRFTSVPPTWRTLVKDYVLLTGDPALATAWVPGAAAENFALSRRPRWGTARSAAKNSFRTLQLMETLDLTDLDTDDWVSLGHEMLTRTFVHAGTGKSLTVSPPTLASAITALREMHDLSPLHGHDKPFGSRPWGYEDASEAAHFARPAPGERRNATRPHGHVFAMAGACINLLERCGQDVVERATWWTAHPDVTWHWGQPDPYLDAHPEAVDPAWLPEGDALLPDATGKKGLWFWNNRIVTAAYYVVAAITALRGAEMDALTPGCISTVDGRHTMHGLKIKGRSLEAPPPASWTVNDLVADAVKLVNDLRAARKLEAQFHPRMTDRPVLCSGNLIRICKTRESTLIDSPIETDKQALALVPAMEMLCKAGVGESVRELTLCNHRTVRMTALDVHVDRPLGDLAAAAVGKWSTTSVAMGYIGHRPQITTPAWTDEVVERNMDRAIGPLIQTARTDPERLTGDGARRLTSRSRADADLANGPVSAPVLRSIIKRRHIAVSIGPLSACVDPAGGLCGGAEAANHRLCQLGCQNMVLTSYHRARLELMRRSMNNLLGPNSHLAAKIEAHDDITGSERTMTDDELVDIITADWDPTFRHLVTDLIERTDGE